MKKTYVAKKEDLKRKWYLIDAKDKVLGRLATKIANILRGKNKPIFTPHIDSGDFVIVINAKRIKVTGRKMKNKNYPRFSGYPGGLKEIPLERMLREKPCEVIRLAVSRMMPRNRLSKTAIRKLKVYKDSIHPHHAQPLEVLEV